jgi:hypothetical protein
MRRGAMVRVPNARFGRAIFDQMRLTLRLRAAAWHAAAIAASLMTFAGAVGSRAAAASTEPGPAACQAHVPSRVLPAWARAGFSSPKPRMPYVLGQDGKIAAIQWADPLVSPPSARYNNKILWVSRRPSTPGADLRIGAQKLLGTTLVGPLVRRTVIDGPGPSIINLPSAGCWRLTLRWSGRSDTLDLRYAT